MRRIGVYFCGLCLLLVIGLPVLAKNPKQAPRPAVKGEWAAMVKQCNLTADQQTAVNDKVKAMNAALTDWDAKNKDQVDKLKADIKAAKEANDKAKLKDLNAQQKTLMTGRDAIQQQSRREIMTLLTPEQQQTWAVYQLQIEVKRHFNKAKLTDDQLAKIKPLCENTQQGLAKLTAGEAKGRKALMNKLFADVAQQILTDDQRALMTAKPAPKNQPK